MWHGGLMEQAISSAPTKGELTRERLLDISEAAILAKGFSNTSIDEIIAEAGLTKSGFFYHFRDKTELAKALVERFIVEDARVMDGYWQRARELSDDPLQRFLIGLKFFAEDFENLEEARPGCIVASVAYHDRQFDDTVRNLTAEAVIAWRRRFRTMLHEIAETYPLRIDVNLDHLADMIAALVDGTLIDSRVLNEPQLMVEQVLLYRRLVQAVFLGSER